MSKLWILAAGLFLLSGCDKTGTCEFTYDQASPDNSIPAGLAVCDPKSLEERCDKGAMSAVTQGLKTSGYTFTKGATCVDRGYKDCSGGRGMIFYKSCPGK